MGRSQRPLGGSPMHRDPVSAEYGISAMAAADRPDGYALSDEVVHLQHQRSAS